MTVRHRIVGDLSSLPHHAFGPRSLMWWGVLGFMLIEGTAFLLAGGSYFFLAGHVRPWPPAADPPDLLWGTLFTLLILLSEIPNVWLKKQARAERDAPVRLGLIIMSLAAGLLLVVRWQEFGALNTRWDRDPYGSIIWALMLLHTTHLITDFGDTAFVTLTAHTHAPDGEFFAEISDNSLYWRFVVLTWLPIYALVYWGPRVLG